MCVWLPATEVGAETVYPWDYGTWKIKELLLDGTFGMLR